MGSKEKCKGRRNLLRSTTIGVFKLGFLIDHAWGCCEATLEGVVVVCDLLGRHHI